MVSKTYHKNVFLNCPFDVEYQPIYEAIIFTVLAAGFVIRCSREADDAAETRIAKIIEIIRQSRFGIHDISRVELDAVNGLPRFNMPLELGLFLGARFFDKSGTKKPRRKSCLVLDVQPYRYQKFISDIAGQDIRAHGNSPEVAIGEVRSWLSTESGMPLPGKTELVRSYHQFRSDLPIILDQLRLLESEMQFTDYRNVCIHWIRRGGAEIPAEEAESG